MLKVLSRGCCSQQVHAPYLLQLGLVHWGAGRGWQLRVRRPAAAAVDLSDHLEEVPTFVSTSEGRDACTRGGNRDGQRCVSVGSHAPGPALPGAGHSSARSHTHASIRRCWGGFGLWGNRPRGSCLGGLPSREHGECHRGTEATRGRRVHTERWPLTRQRGCLRPRDHERPDGGDVYAASWAARGVRHVERRGKGFRATGRQVRRPVGAVTGLRSTRSSCGRRRARRPGRVAPPGPARTLAPLRRSGEAWSAPRRGVRERRPGSSAAPWPRAHAPGLTAWLRPGLRRGPMRSPLRASVLPSGKSGCGSAPPT